MTNGGAGGAGSTAEPMNIDDFIISENLSTPGGIPFPPSLPLNHGERDNNLPITAAAPSTFVSVGDDAIAKTATASMNGIPIKSRKGRAKPHQQHQDQGHPHPHPQQQQQQQQQFVPQSVPDTLHHQSNEFSYVQRHHRKTSIDDRRVSQITFLASFFLLNYTLRRDA